MGKLFTSVLNERLYRFCEENNIIKELQAAFRKGYSTLDHIFVLKGLVDIMRCKKRRSYTVHLLITRKRLIQYGEKDFGIN